MRSLFHAFLLCSLCLCCLQQAYGQRADTADLISVSLRIVGKGIPSYNRIPPYNKDTIPGYFAAATLTNKQDTTIHFWIMTCSWPVHNWVTSNDSIFFGFPGCDRNIPDRIDLSPHQSVDFYGLFETVNKRPLPKTVKLGFIYFASFNDIWESLHQRNISENLKVYWSGPVRIADNLYRYQVN
ncbi:MAG TPA: hypothetical protein VG052_07800 [Puia sp.]|nr:hypothetical protein [Puia sp.]